MIVRSAFNNLVKEGYISKKRGIGSIILVNRIFDNIGTVESYTKEMVNKGYSIITKLISLTIVEALISTEELMELLELDYESPILHIEQVGVLENGEASEYSHTYHYVYKLTLNAAVYKF